MRVCLGIYFLIKVCYLINGIGQFFLMNHFLNIDYWSYGQKVLYGVFSGRDWMENKVYFPRIVYCDFAIRYLGDNNLNYTVKNDADRKSLVIAAVDRSNAPCL